MKHQLKVLQATLGLLFTEGKGLSGTAFPKQPPQLLELYEFEACPYCRRVRQALTALNLDYIVYPCPKNGTLFRTKVIEMTNKQQFPYFIDPNTGVALHESKEIIDYLFRTYGKKDVPPPLYWQELKPKAIKNSIISALSMLRGMNANTVNKSRIATKNQPTQLLELYSFDMSPYSRCVRELLCELELPFICRNLPKERWQDIGLANLRIKMGPYEPKRAGKREKVMNTVMNGRMQVPFLIDPNTDTQLFDSKAICSYLTNTYGVKK